VTKLQIPAPIDCNFVTCGRTSPVGLQVGRLELLDYAHLGQALLDQARDGAVSIC
jgi:hypothetical protein